MSPSIRNQAKLAAIALAAGLAGTLFGAGAAVADSPHFIRANIDIDNFGNLVCSWKEAGLGTNQNIDYSCGAEVVGVLERCFTRSGNKPQAANKVSSFSNVNEEQPFNSGKNGQITGSITTPVPSAESFCPPGQVQRTVAVRWCNASLEDLTTPLTGATANELFKELITGDQSTVPSCENLLANPG